MQPEGCIKSGVTVEEETWSLDSAPDPNQPQCGLLLSPRVSHVIPEAIYAGVGLGLGPRLPSCFGLASFPGLRATFGCTKECGEGLVSFLSCLTSRVERS